MSLTTETRQRLAGRMEERRRELRLRWRDVAAAGDIALKTLHSVRTGTAGIAALTEAGIEAGLQWKPGSVRSIVAGGEPEAREPEPAPRSFIDADKNDPEMRPFVESVLRDQYRSAGIKLLPGQEVPVNPEVDALTALKPGHLVFSLEHEQATWDTDLLTVEQKRYVIAKNRKLVAEWQAEQHRIRGLPSESAHWYPCGSRVHVHAGQPAG